MVFNGIYWYIMVFNGIYIYIMVYNPVGWLIMVYNGSQQEIDMCYIDKAMGHKQPITQGKIPTKVPTKWS